MLRHREAPGNCLLSRREADREAPGNWVAGKHRETACWVAGKQTGKHGKHSRNYGRESVAPIAISEWIFSVQRFTLRVAMVNEPNSPNTLKYLIIFKIVCRYHCKCSEWIKIHSEIPIRTKKTKFLGENNAQNECFPVLLDGPGSNRECFPVSGCLKIVLRRTKFTLRPNISALVR